VALNTGPAKLCFNELLETIDVWIVEDYSKRPHGIGLFWGAAMRENDWHGENWLGVLWMELRDQLKADPRFAPEA